ncbi:integral membrane protein [Streptoalloteichus tenebrarius]|uniref:Integral membrane protein n=1 Tax=Streptoalloteichus tenebrarius (strain ATCC 17920 / DSM 40477 / JCM 4838 / CBS 697.72 / NBRC 16177 / NCIMB 11028 / NRRL B-12390 / A12253. 1 / ISP 5477) TaxID=1933 RepID=A0ABT1HQC0_STRSD|nr:DUF3817 domain-containing protein [Streptoalloteichus tenebrarius]MCP2257724.1 integral membrane protein [Streptoalloteichus tenebrarius]BFE99922.1 DUF3817 domain-containing protein [Streptoalloteichus tenebrarius]
MNGALTRFRIAAYVVGVGLLALVLVAMPLKYFADQPLMVQVVGPVHGFLYAVYLLVTFDLAVRSKWPVPRTLGVLVAGTIPFVSFVVERMVVRQTREEAGEAQEATAA